MKNGGTLILNPSPVREKEDRACHLDIPRLFLMPLASGWLAGVWCGRCGLVARVPQDRMLSRSVTLNKLDGRPLQGTLN
jgi:hypothetical protein